jgi:hypothetical protein
MGAVFTFNPSDIVKGLVVSDDNVFGLIDINACI